LELLLPIVDHGRVDARCFNTSAFTYPYGNAHWISNNFERKADAPNFGGCQQKEIDTWWSDAATILQGHKGVGFGQQDSVAIEQEPVQKFVSSKALANACHSALLGSVTVYANSFFVGAPHSGQLARFFGPSGKGSANQAGDYHIEVNESVLKSFSGLAASVDMAPVDEAVCYFTAISGVFGTDLDQISIEPKATVGGKPAWRLVAWSDQPGDNFLSARARCFLREQPGHSADGGSPHQICRKDCVVDRDWCMSQVGNRAESWLRTACRNIIFVWRIALNRQGDLCCTLLQRRIAGVNAPLLY
jgi:hypothetical protein